MVLSAIFTFTRLYPVPLLIWDWAGVLLRHAVFGKPARPVPKVFGGEE